MRFRVDDTSLIETTNLKQTENLHGFEWFVVEKLAILAKRQKK